MTIELLAEVDLLRKKCEAYQKSIEDIKAEIEAKAKEREFYLDSGHPYDGLYEALEIIDKHCGGGKE